MQVLKGPQGTLFGRNTTGGAVLYYTKQPTYEVGGYASALIGNYDRREFEGAVNVPVIEDRIALRIAGQYRKRDGYTKSAQGFAAADDLDARAFRISLLVEPTDSLKNVTVYDYFRENDVGAGLQATGYPSVTGPNGERATFRLFGPLFDCNVSPSCDFDLALARQKAVGPRRYFTSVELFNKATIQGLSNTTTLSLGDVTIKNIFGYRKVRVNQSTDVDGTEMTALDAFSTLHSDDQVSNELQASGALFNGSLNWLAGGFYLKNDPKGPNAIALDLFRPSVVPRENWQLNFLGEAVPVETSKAVFLSLSQDLASAVEGLKINASGRYTWD